MAEMIDVTYWEQSECFAGPAIKSDARSYLDRAWPGISRRIPARGVLGTAIAICSIVLLAATGMAQAPDSSAHFPAYMSDHFDYAAFTRYDAPVPPKTLIYQSNGFMALQEYGFGGQKIIIPVAGAPAPTTVSERLSAIEIDSPVFIDSSQRTYRFDGSPGKRGLTYFADRTVYRIAFDGGPRVSLTVYPVYGKPAAVLKISIDRARGPVSVTFTSREDGFHLLPSEDSEIISYGSSKWPYRLLLAASPWATRLGGSFQWELNPGSTAALMMTSGGAEQEAKTALNQLRASPDLLDTETHRLWNEYLASAPLTAPADPIKFTIGTSGEHQRIEPQELIRSQLWNWRGLLTTTCQVHYLPACPMTIADWNVFVGMWSNDGIAETVALAATNRSDLARTSILNWFRYSVNATGDGTSAITIFPSGKNTFQAEGPERSTQGVPVQATLVGEYVRLTGDTSVLNEKPGGVAGDRTLWQALLAYQRNLLKVRDVNQDHLIDWLHSYETGWDDKNSPFIDLAGDATSSINEQVFNLWSLREMVYLSRIQGEDPSPWENEFAAAQEAVHARLWDNTTQRYWDLDVKTGKLWTQGENLDAYYLLYFETNQARVDAMMRRLNDPAKFNGALLPTMAFDTPKWGGYWRGPAWPREFSYVALGLDRSGHGQEGFDWLSRAITSNVGPVLQEHADPKAYPVPVDVNDWVCIMGYNALDALVLADVAGLRTWGGDDLTVEPAVKAGKVYVRGQRWMGDRYDALFDPGHPTLIWRNEHALDSLSANQVWRARKQGGKVDFELMRALGNP